MRATFRVPDRVVAEAPMRKVHRWQRVLAGRGEQGHFSLVSYREEHRPGAVTLRFDWSSDQHAWMRRFLGRFTKAWAVPERSGDA